MSDANEPEPDVLDADALAALLPGLAAVGPDPATPDAQPGSGLTAIAPVGGTAPNSALPESSLTVELADVLAGSPAATGDAATEPLAATPPLAGAALATLTTASGSASDALPASSPDAADAAADALLTTTSADAKSAAHLAAAFETRGDPARAPAPSASAGLAQPDRSAVAAERMVTLAELPRALLSEVDGFLRVRGHGRDWEAEIRLDPPELGALHFRLEMRGHALHGVVRVEDPQLEPQLERFLKDLEQDLRKQGGEASFDLSRGTREGGEEAAWSRPADARSRVPGGDAPLSVRERGTGPDVDRLVDLLA